MKKLPKPKSKDAFHSYLKKPLPNSFFCSVTTSTEVSTVIQSLDAKKAQDVYKFPIRIIKDLQNQLSVPLAHIINESFSKGVFPEKLKLAKVIPLFKGGDRCETKNYRPMSILPIFDKIIERLMHLRLIPFLKKYNILNPSQYGFQKQKSTTLATV